MNESYVAIKRHFRRKIEEHKNEITAAIIGGNCVDYTTYKSMTAKINGINDAFSLFIESIKELAKDDLDEDDDTNDND